MSLGSMRPRRAKTGRRKAAMVVMGLVLIGAGLFVFRYTTEIAGRVGDLVSPPPAGAGNVTGVGMGQEAYVPFVVWGFGFSLIGAGAAMIRSGFMSAMMGGGVGGGMTGMAGMEPEAMNSYMQQALTTANRATMQPGSGQTAEREVVKIKCRNCGSLEAEDAMFCRKCGKAI